MEAVYDHGGLLLTSLMFAASGGHQACVTVLLEAKANVSYNASGNTALSLARENGHTECADLLASALKREVHSRD